MPCKKIITVLKNQIKLSLGGKKMKRILALLLVVATIFAFAACKKTDKENNGKTTGGDTDAIADVITDGSSDGSESEFSSDGTLANNKKPGTRPTGKKTNLGTNTTVKPSTQEKPAIPNKHTYKIVVEKKNSKGMAEVIVVDGTRYDLKNGNDVAALKKRVDDEKENNLLGQLYETDPTITVQLGLNALDEGSVLSYKYDPEGEYFYVDDLNSWQQQFGFNPLYDFGAGFTVMYYDTVRIKFSYGTDEKGRSKDYMLQLWKGQYGLMFIGSEIGFYEKDKDKAASNSAALEHYECATDHLLPMEMVCYRYDANGKLNPLFKSKYARHWWSTGFVPGVLKNFLNRSELVVEARITFDDDAMAKVVGDAFKANKFKEISPSQHDIHKPDTYYVSGSDVIFTWRMIQHPKKVDILKNTTRTTTPPSTTAAHAATTTAASAES